MYKRIVDAKVKDWLLSFFAISHYPDELGDREFKIWWQDRMYSQLSTKYLFIHFKRWNRSKTPQTSSTRRRSSHYMSMKMFLKEASPWTCYSTWNTKNKSCLLWGRRPECPMFDPRARLGQEGRRRRRERESGVGLRAKRGEAGEGRGRVSGRSSRSS